MRSRSFGLLALAMVWISGPALAAAKGKVLVVLSSASAIDVRVEGTSKETKPHDTGFFLSELMVPVRAIKANNYELVFANPAGNEPAMDSVSDQKLWFNNDRAEYEDYRKQCEEMKLCSPAPNRFAPEKVRKLSEVIREGLDQFSGVFFPGGHAPMQDLYRDESVGKILNHFHQNALPTALICHAPIALLAAGDAQNWPYDGYRMTVFSTKEEQEEEPGQKNMLGGFVLFYPDEKLDSAGGKVVVRARKWQSHIEVDRELITGQNPMSDHALALAFIAALEKVKR